MVTALLTRLAGLFTLEPMDEAVGSTPATSAASLALGETGHVVALSPACRGAQRRRLLDLGIVPGTRIVLELSAPGGDPIAFRVRGALIALRRDQAALVHVDRATGAHI